jgi:hypothetical protein
MEEEEGEEEEEKIHSHVIFKLKRFKCKEEDRWEKTPHL